MRTLPPLLILLAAGSLAAAEPGFTAGFAKVDVTPEQPLRLSGYQDRDRPYLGVESPLFARAMALRANGGETFVLVSLDTIGMAADFTRDLADRLGANHGVARERFVLCATHSHTAPKLATGLNNIYQVPVSAEEQRRSEVYTATLKDRIVAAVAEAIAGMEPARLARGTGTVGFAVNRRALTDGTWSGFGVNPDGPVDHGLPVLRVTDDSGEVRGILFNYACHATTLTGNFNRLTGDWPGFAARDIEERFPGSVALCTIGAGADMNPEPRGELEHALVHGRELALEAAKLVRGDLAPVTAAPTAAFDYVGLAFDRPSRDELKDRLGAADVQTRRHAEYMLGVLDRKGRLPASYPAPVQVWRFGDQLTMVFLGGEVVVDYGLRLKAELPGGAVWVTAYANDVFGYVASERLLREGGYEVDRSMIYYMQPGRWAAGVEETIVGRVRELAEGPANAGPLDPEEAVGAFQLPPGFRIEAVAVEPLVQDPIQFAFGADGRLWVVEMGDYPGPERSPDEAATHDSGATETGGGTVKVLTDTDRDGRFDAAATFLDGLRFPTGVLPWRDGALIVAAPDVLFAADTDGDGRADRVEPLFTGFRLANPQHRVNGFTPGLDNWVHLGSGDTLGTIASVRGGKSWTIPGRDLAIRPDAGELLPTSGRSQYGRPRSDDGLWFGNDNTRPLWHYVVEDRYLIRNPHARLPDPKQQLFDPPRSPRVFPAVASGTRFNDLATANRFTSACGPTIYRDDAFGADLRGAAFVCEPVHHLVHLALLKPDGVTFRAERPADQRESEFLAAADPWSRPVYAATGPDGALWIADMYRQVIEHPKWIPDDWLARVDVRAGEDRGRIYRVFRETAPPGHLPDLTALSDAALVGTLRSPNGPRRDLAQRLLIERRATGAAPALRELARGGGPAPARLHALGTLLGLDLLDAELLRDALAADDPAVVRFALRLAEPFLADDAGLGERLLRLAEHPDLGVRFQTALSLGEWNDPRAAEALTAIALRDAGDRWVRTAVLSSSVGRAAAILDRAAADLAPEWVSPLFQTAFAVRPDNAATVARDVLRRAAADPPSERTDRLAAGVLGAMKRREAMRDDSQARAAVGTLLARAAETAADRTLDPPRRVAAIELLAHRADRDAAVRDRLGERLAPVEPPGVRTAALRALSDSANDDVPDRFFAAWAYAGPALRADLATELLNRPAWTRALRGAVEEGVIAADDLGAAAQARLLASPDADLRRWAAERFAPQSASNEERRAILERQLARLGGSGDASRGRIVFEKLCATCHRLGGVGQEFGPQLAALSDRSNRNLLTAIVDPDRAIEDRYRQYLALTEDGRVLNGLILSESAASITFGQANGTTVEVPRADLVEYRSETHSLMPDGLHRDLSDEQLTDLLTFVRDAGSVRDAGTE